MGLQVEYGWQNFWFTLHNTSLNSFIRLEEKDKDGDWVDRDPPNAFFGIAADEKIKKWETTPNIRFANLKRNLKAEARFHVHILVIVNTDSGRSWTPDSHALGCYVFYLKCSRSVNDSLFFSHRFTF